MLSVLTRGRRVSSTCIPRSVLRGQSFLGTLWSMADQRDEAVRKGAHCAWPLHYHIVLPVKYRKSRRDEVVTTIIQETAAEIAERFPIKKGERMGRTRITSIGSAVRIRKWRQAGLCKDSRASRRGRSFAESPR